MAEGKDNELRNRAAHLKQLLKAHQFKLSVAVMASITEALAEFDKLMGEKEGYEREGSLALAEPKGGQAERRLNFAREELGKYGIGEEAEGQPPSEELPVEERGERGPAEEEEEEPAEGREQGGTIADKAQKVKDLYDKAQAARRKVEQAKRKIEQVKKAAETAKKVGKVAQALAKLAPVLLNPWFWLVVLIIVIIIGLFMWFGGVAHKSLNEQGGSIPIPMNFSDPKDVTLAGQVAALRNGGMLVFAPGLEKDIEWQEEGGKAVMNLDWRVMVVLKYLGDKWAERSNGVIGVSLSYTNGPEFTRSRAVLSAFGATIGGGDTVDAMSAYQFGQAIGIDEIGRVSNELARACFGDSDGNVNNNPPVEVKWQEMASEDIIRPTYEQLQVDGKLVYEGGKVLAGLAKRAKGDAAYKTYLEGILTKASEDAWYTKVGNALDYMIINLTKTAELRGKGIDARTRDYAQQALTNLQTVREKTRGDVVAWDEASLQQQLAQGLQMAFRMMQVANVVGWQNPRNCRLWKAYEARQHIRQLVLDLEQLPTSAQFAAAGQNWNSDLMVRQLIVYSPEDDLDNGRPDLDVFPKGAVAVDEGGVGYDDTGKDGIVDEKDGHFSDLPIDGGVFSKASTIFVYKAQGAWENAQSILKDLALDVTTVGAYQLLDQMHDIFSGAGASFYAGEDLKKVTYKNFVHVGF